AWDLVKDFSLAERNVLRDGVPRQAMNLPFRNGTVRDLAREALAISRDGLRRRAALNADGQDETRFLDVLQEIVDSGKTAAERKLELFHGRWNGSVDPLFGEFAY
ncbi:MAG: glutamate--cysteine ligase, partial [Stenotrophomonas sp.]